MIDIHCHILPGIDDGSDNFTESLLMARQAEKEGISTIIATPHHQNGRYNNYKADIIEKTAELNEYLQTENINVEILPGQETRIYGELLEDYEAGEILTLANISSYLFIELPSNHVPGYTEQLCFDTQMQGLTPVIVHPERNSELIEHPDKLYKLVKNGVATQITAGSFTGYFGKKIQKFTFDLIESNLTHFLASDAHNTTKRCFKMEEAYELLKKKYGTDSLYYFMDNAELITEGKDIDREIPTPIKRKKILGIF
ncbi:tyrosine-protein phosphatase [Lederbergia lenta]|uniref:Tyrosine-protein phosphatase n=1 Tax=Lederbergia lenta TaxID=1467 RepID=A0A2X4ZR51_LEDLE|nr:CpsB/CapC family capsule biosynthesis tyrosine phosphatase [Lederbergia lenta]MEC2323160.1 tyrosine protein phosphatase [Lederbergia lenta]SQI62844.1 protein-tyrosine-phosphatase [Lederbergia lenta]